MSRWRQTGPTLVFFLHFCCWTWGTCRKKHCIPRMLTLQLLQDKQPPPASCQVPDLIKPVSLALQCYSKGCFCLGLLWVPPSITNSQLLQDSGQGIPSTLLCHCICWLVKPPVTDVTRGSHGQRSWHLWGNWEWTPLVSEHPSSPQSSCIDLRRLMWQILEGQKTSRLAIILWKSWSLFRTKVVISFHSQLWLK